MFKLVGMAVIFACVLGGFVMAGGQLMVLVQPVEVLIIGGSALGAFLQANPIRIFKIVLAKSPSMFKERFTHEYYTSVLCMMYEILNKARRDGLLSLEDELDDPNSSTIFSKYPDLLKDERLITFVCDYLRIMSMGSMAPHEFENLFDMEINSLKEELDHPAHAVNKVAEGLPGFGIVAAVLGVVVTMGMIGDGDKEALGHHVAAALIGTFLGILAAYGFFGPLSNLLEHDAKEELNVYESIKASMVAFSSGLPPALAAEFGRKVLMPGHRPSYKELDASIREATKR
ncbi:flagellar motor stator protein MotA [Pokkaliibacter sp. CJK22405]|uniref:flagellar motor stator protein MotA n=1 Tax=Pokkaliibacter sp. CJK22405 TaxID=3384615 RepID=UPI00398528BF